jgi:NAD(P)H-flavin reductase
MTHEDLNPMQEPFVRCRNRSELISNNVYRLFLHRPPGMRKHIEAGHYLKIVLDEQTRLPFSLANYVGDGAEIELHVRISRESDRLKVLESAIKERRDLDIQLPMGNCVLPKKQKDLVIVCWGTGFAQAKALIERALHRNWQKSIKFFRLGRRLSDFYLESLVDCWQKKCPQLEYYPVLSTRQAIEKDGLTQIVVQKILALSVSLTDTIVYSSGSGEDVDLLFSSLRDVGFQSDQFFSDSLSFPTVR